MYAYISVHVSATIQYGVTPTIKCVKLIKIEYYKLWLYTHVGVQISAINQMHDTFTRVQFENHETLPQILFKNVIFWISRD